MRHCKTHAECVQRIVCAFALTAWLAACANGPGAFSPSVPDQPEGGSGRVDKPGWSGARFAVAAANPLAADAGYQILRAGGSAIDAAIAAQMVLALVEPQSSGLGGGALLLHYDGHAVEAFDGRETAPAAAHERLLLEADGKPMAFYEAVVGGRAVGVPGTLRMLESVHQRHGRLPWAALFQPAIALATSGFRISPRLHGLLNAEIHLRKDPMAAAYFYQPDGTPHEVGFLLRNPALADILQKIAASGAKALMEGDIAQAMVDKVRGHRTNPGLLSLDDLARYQPKMRAPLCHDYHARTGEYRMCGFPPPSSGGIAIGQILGLLQHTPAGTLPLQEGLPSSDWLHLYLEAARLAFADRAQYVADPDFVSPPGGDWMRLLEPAYLKDRARLIGSAPGAPPMQVAPHGTPEGVKTTFAPMADQPEYGTTHLSIVDGQGRAVAMTSTIEDGFGARLMVNPRPELAGGFLLNNELTDFSFAPTDATGRPVANRIEPGKRPRSSMAPTLVFDKASGALVVSAGSPGGAMIIHFTAKTLYGILQWGLAPQEAIALPNFGSLGGPALLEEKSFPGATLDALRARGHVVREMPMTSGLQAITLDRTQTAPVWRGGADPRREGVVMGD